MVTQGANVRRCVLVFSSLFLTVQIVVLAATVVFYLYACSEAFKDVLAREIFTRLYPKSLWRSLRRNNALQFHILISGAVQLLLVVPTILVVAGASRGIRFLLLPWLIVFGLLQLAMVVAIPLCVLYLPDEFKLLGAGVAAVEALVAFPWWFSVIHLFAVLEREAAVDLATSVSTDAVRIASLADRHPHPAYYHDVNRYSFGRSSMATKMSEV